MVGPKPSPPALSAPVPPKPFNWGILVRSWTVVWKPEASISGRPTVIRFEPVGWAPRMLVPVTVTVSGATLELVSWAWPLPMARAEKAVPIIKRDAKDDEKRPERRLLKRMLSPHC